MTTKNINPIEVIAVNDCIARIKTYLLNLQQYLCQMLETEAGGQTFSKEHWQHASGGGGITRVLSADPIIEKAGVNFSHVMGNGLPTAALVKYPTLKEARFQALGVSAVIHPQNPYVPTAHFNVRFFVAESEAQQPYWWFGGGFDLTPYYPFAEDCKHWHACAKAACSPFGEAVYPQFKKAADDYFYLPHRQEARGIGGIFYDELNHWGFEKCFTFMQNVGEQFACAYQPILTKRKQHAYSQRELDFQAYRRGRYVEYNLIYDRGTLFGLQFGGRIESILMSLPPRVNWTYQWQPAPGSREAELYEKYLPPRDWV